jgi:hypothetical protein
VRPKKSILGLEKEADSVRHLIRFAIAVGNAYFEAMPRKPLDLPMKVARAFIEDMRRDHAESDAVKQRAFAERQLEALQPFLRPRDKPLQLRDIIMMFDEMKDQTLNRSMNGSHANVAGKPHPHPADAWSRRLN